MPRPVVRVFPLASCRLARVGVVSRVTVLVPSVIQTLVEELLGTPVGLQFEPLFQLLLPPFQVDTVPLSVHWQKAAGAEKQATASRATNAPTQRLAHPSSFLPSLGTTIEFNMRLEPPCPDTDFANLTIQRHNARQLY